MAEELIKKDHLARAIEFVNDARRGMKLLDLDDKVWIYLAFMLALIDPGCGLCKASVDYMRQIRIGIQDEGIRYFLVSFNTDRPGAEFFEYCESSTSSN